MKLSIRNKLLGISFAAIVVPLIGSALAIYLIVTGRSQEESVNKMRTHSRIAISEVVKRWDEMKSFLDGVKQVAIQYDFTGTFAKVGDQQEKGGIERERALNVLEYFEMAGKFDYLTLADDRGRVVARANNISSSGDDLTQDSMVREALQTRTVLCGPVVLPVDFLNQERLNDRGKLGAQKKEVQSALAIQVAVPLIKNDSQGNQQLVGIIVGGETLNNNSRLVDDFKKLAFQDNKETFEAGSATIYMRTGDGALAVASSRSGEFGRGIGDAIGPEIFEKVVKQGREVIGPETVKDKSYISAYVPLKDTSNRVIGVYAVSVKETWFREFQTRTGLLITIVIGLTLLLSTGLTYLMAARLTRPIEEIIDSANKISLGDLDIPIKTRSSGDEVGDLAESLERMRISLKSAIERLRRR